LLIKLGAFDVAIIAAYFLAVLAIGFKLKGKMESSSDFLLSRKSFSHWITGIAFMSANLGALEVLDTPQTARNMACAPTIGIGSAQFPP
jgi:solute:Na+ symporter, SSS family